MTTDDSAPRLEHKSVDHFTTRTPEMSLMHLSLDDSGRFKDSKSRALLRQAFANQDQDNLVSMWTNAIPLIQDGEQLDIQS
jgi:predicted secreted protein